MTRLFLGTDVAGCLGWFFFLAHPSEFLYNAGMPTVLAVIIALFFFFAGCFKLGSFIARTSVGDLPEYLDSLMLQAWPLAIAAVLFVLIDIRLQRSVIGLASDDETDIPESSLPNRTAISSNSTGNSQMNRHGSYFHIDGQELPPQSPAQAGTPSSGRAKAAVPAPFSTPPPFESKAPNSPQSPEPKTEPSPQNDTDLNFFKL